jgi:hypothetical protein
MFEQHEIVSANGLWTESFFYGDQEVSGLESATRRELREIFSDQSEVSISFSQTARYCLKKHEAALISL